MNDKPPSQREHEVLVLIHRHFREYEEPPFSNWLSDESGLSLKNILTIIGRLVKKGYVVKQDNRFILTERAVTYFSNLYDSVKIVKPFDIIPTQVRLQGQVKAGPIEHDLEVKLYSPNEEVSDFILIPEVKPERKTYALQVVGQSMEHEGIHEGDYVVVEEFGPTEWPKQGELIITRYLELPAYLRKDPEIDVNDFELSGLTLKVYNEVMVNGERFYRLGWKKDHRSNLYQINAVKIEPVGRITGIYRPIRARKFNT